jgi:[acyl-carrier-protein] S-malonyltransferase
VTQHVHTLTRPAGVIGWVDGQPVSHNLLDLRLEVLRSGPGSAALPREGTQEGRQLRRWTAHVLFTELLCLATAGRLELAPDGPVALDPLAAVQLGSITAAAWQGCPAVGAVCQTLFGVPAIAPDDTAIAVPRVRRWHRVTQSLTRDGELDAGPLRPLGWTTLDDLPPELAAALMGAAPGETVGPIRSQLGWHVARLDEVVERAEPMPQADRGPQLRAFTIWLERRRHDSLTVATGFEHPGDPRQPDNTHRH